jgi:hypothetical protein
MQKWKNTGSYKATDTSDSIFLNIGHKTIDGSCIAQSSDCMLDVNEHHNCSPFEKNAKIEKQSKLRAE